VPRYPLSRRCTAGFDPERWTGADVERPPARAARWLRHSGLDVRDARREDPRTLARFDPSHLTPEEHFARLSD
jgi:hypothetical protein